MVDVQQVAIETYMLVLVDLDRVICRSGRQGAWRKRQLGIECKRSERYLGQALGDEFCFV
jgi:hypothetical protein